MKNKLLLNSTSLNYFQLVLLLLITLPGCMRKDHVMVESDYSYRGNFRKYSSFCFAKVTQDNDSSMNNPVLTKAIKSRMELQGYQMTQKKPSLLVFYKVYYKDLKLQGYVQPEIENWVKNEDDDAKYDPVKYSLKEGTLLIQLVDAKRNHTVWQGYASGVFDPNSLNNEKYLKRAVRMVFDRYRLFARGFLANENPDASPEDETEDVKEESND
ncbi:MAG: DUF4136 domain-containing protein [Bacteroidota bacterium]